MNAPFSRDWHARASVRAARASVEIAPGSDANALFPERLVPLARHPLIVAKGVQREVHTAHLARYLAFTRALEIATVNPVAMAVAVPSLEAAVLDRLSNADRAAFASEALRLTCDEAFHAVEADDLMAALGVSAAPPAYLDAVRARCDRAGDPFLVLLGFVTISETLVSQTLRQLPHDPLLASSIRRFVENHARDEAWHSRFFSALFTAVWATLSVHERRSLGTELPRLLSLFLAPDLAAIERELFSYGFTVEERGAILCDLCLAAAPRSNAHAALQLFRRSGLFADRVIRAAFEREGWIDPCAG